MVSLFKKLWNNKRGNALVIAGAALPMVVGAAGLASDTIQWTLWKRQLQRAADSAAIAGVYDRNNAKGGTETVAKAVENDLKLNLHTWMDLSAGFPAIETPANAGLQVNQVKVTLQIQQRLPFSSMFMSAAPMIRASATAASVPSAGNPCVRALVDDPKLTGLIFSGDADIDMPECDLFSNSPSKDSSVAKGSSKVKANSTGGVGGIQESDNFDVNYYRPYSPKIGDPYADVTPLASDMHCAQQVTGTTTITVVDTPAWDEQVPKKSGKGFDTVHHPAVTHNETVNTYGPMALTESTDLSKAKAADGTTPANCFSELSVASGKSLTLPAGTYYINAGNANIQGDLSCSGCTIVLTNIDTANNATIGDFKVNASSKINMTAPTTGDFKGIAIYQDRRAETGASKVNKVNGNSGSIIEGALYFPKQKLEYNGTGTTDATCTMFVAWQVEFSGNSATSNKFKSINDPTCAGFGFPGDDTGWMVRLVA